MSKSGYCVKCRKKVDIQEAKEVTWKNGMKALSGKCGVCFTGVNRILGKA